MRTKYFDKIKSIFANEVEISGNIIRLRNNDRKSETRSQTTQVFSEKWLKFDKEESKNNLFDFQKGWYLDLYGFDANEGFGEFLKNKSVILDAGCGLGYKAAWFANLAPSSLVIAVDLSESVNAAADNYLEIENLFFVQGDISDTYMKSGSIDYVSCDQVIMHTKEPEMTFDHLASLLSEDGEFSCYVYRKKALPRELLDDHFRENVHKLSSEELWKLSEQLTELGKVLSELNISIDVPAIPLLGIKEGKYDIQRFIYWNFLKCFWNQELGLETSISTNFDWYSPSQARRFSRNEFLNLAEINKLNTLFFHEEEACYTARFKRGAL